MKYLWSRQWEWTWLGLQVGVALLPLFPALGAIILGLISLVGVVKDWPSIKVHPFNWGLGILGAGFIGVTLVASDREDATFGLANLLPFMLLLVVIPPALSNYLRLRRLAWLIVLPALLIALLGWGQQWLGWQGGWSWLGWTLVAGGEPQGRMAAVFSYANILAAYFTIVFGFCLGLGIESWQQWQQTGQRFYGYRLGLLSIILVLVSGGLYGCSSRNAWAIAGLMILAFAVYLGWHWLLWFMGAVMATVLWSAYGRSPSRDWLRQVVPQGIWQRLADELYPDRPVARLRITQWQTAWDMASQRPFTGWGLRSFTDYYLALSDEWLGHPHNLFLMLAAETGWITTLLIFGLVGWLFCQSIRQLRELRAISAATSPLATSDALILWTYIVVFGGLTLFNCFDVTLFDLRLNCFGWVILSGLSGIVMSSRSAALSSSKSLLFR